MSFTQVGTSLGLGFGAIVTGWTADAFGWRAAFLIVAVPGFILAPLFYLTVREPQRGRFDAPSEQSDMATWDGLKYLFGIPTIRRLLTAKMIHHIATGGLLAWLPTFFLRVHGMSPTQMSAGYGLAIGAGSIIGAIIAGLATDKLSHRGERWRNYYCAIGIASATPLMLATFLAPTPTWSLIIFFLAMLPAGGITVTSMVAAMSVVRPKVRGLMASAIGFCMSVIGGGLGPLMFGAMNDLLKPSLGDRAVGATLCLVPVLWLVAAIFYYAAARTTDADVERVGSASGGAPIAA